MEQKTNGSEFAISDIIKMFRGKSKILISITLVFAIIGGLYPIFKTVALGEYGNTVTFHVSAPENSEDLIPLLRSESFAERLLLDENGLPPKEKCNPEDYEAALNSVIECDAIRQNLRNISAETNNFVRNIKLPDGTLSTWENVENEHNRLQEKCDEIVAVLTIYKSAYSDTVASDPNHIIRTQEYEKELENAQNQKKDFDENVYLKALKQKRILDQKYSDEYNRLKQKIKISEALCEKVISPWRNNKQIKQDISIINNSIKIEYANEPDTSDNDDKEKDTKINSSFIKVKISVDRDKEFADRITKSVHSLLPDFVEKSMEKLTTSIDVECTLISPFSEAKLLNTKDLMNRSIKNAILFAFWTFTVCCAYIVGKGYIHSVLSESESKN